MKEKNILQVLGKSHALEILRSLNERAMRFVDLRDVCKSNRTRSARLKEFMNESLIETVPKMIGNRAYTFYEITSQGRVALNLCQKLLKLEVEKKKKSGKGNVSS